MTVINLDLFAQISGSVVVCANLFSRTFPSVMHLKEYYRDFFPITLLCNMLSMHKRLPFANREFALFFENDGQLKCQRKVAFQHAEAFFRRIMATVPTTIDIGAVYPLLPRHLKFSSACAVRTRRELVFDIDLSDYDSVRFCPCKKGAGQASCDVCWLFVDLAVQVMDFLLERKFGLVHRFWVFSGSKGVHCWVLDATAVDYGKEMRQGVCNYLEFRDASQLFECPIARECYDSIIFPFFRKRLFPYLPKSTMLEYLSAFAKPVLDAEGFECLSAAIAAGEPLLACVEKLDKHTKRAFSRVHYPVFICGLLAPRLDHNVTTSEKHLLKAPFAVHKRTQAIALPMSSDDIRNFSPSAAITLQSSSQLVTQLVASSVAYLSDVVILAKPLPELYVCTKCASSDMRHEDLHASVVYDFVESLFEHYRRSHATESPNVSENTLVYLISRQCTDIFGPGSATGLQLTWRRRLQDLNLL